MQNLSSSYIPSTNTTSSYDMGYFYNWTKDTLRARTNELNGQMLSKENIQYVDVVSGTYSGLVGVLYSGKTTRYNTTLQTACYIVRPLDYITCS